MIPLFSRSTRALAIAAAATALAAGPARADEPAKKPDAPAKGAKPRKEKKKKGYELEFTGSLLGAFDNNLFDKPDRQFF